MTRGLSRQQTALLRVVHALIDVQPTKVVGGHFDGLGRLRSASTYENIDALWPLPDNRPRSVGLRRRRPVVLETGLCTKSQLRSLQRALQGLVRRGDLVTPSAVPGQIIDYTTPEELER